MSSLLLHVAAEPEILVTERTPLLLLEAEAYLPEAARRGRSEESIVARYLIAKTVARTRHIPDFVPQSDLEGKPVWEGRLFWSMSHKGSWVGVIVADHPVGIDVEVLCSRDPALFSLFSAAEWEVLGEKNWHNFYRLWTAKEAMIKRERGAIDLLASIKLVAAEKSDLIVAYQGTHMHLRSARCDNCIYSFTL